MQQIQKIQLSKIEYSPTNPRKTFDDAKLHELKESMVAIGLQTPVKVRPRGKAFELVYGERRVRAAELAHWPDIDAIVEDMEDVQVLEAQLVENAQREEVHPIEEAEIFLTLHRDHEYTTEKLAAKCGKSISHVLSRLKVATGLGARGKKACLDGAVIPSVADLIARLDPKLQDEALDYAMGLGPKAGSNETWAHESKLRELGIEPERVARADDRYSKDAQPLSYRAFQKIYQAKFATRLDTAPFDTKDAELAPEVGACTTCPNNSGHAPSLFPDFAKAAGVCVNTACFAMKTERTFDIARALAEQRGLKVLDEKVNEKLAKQLERGTGDFVKPDAHVPADLLPAGSKPITWEKMLGKKHDVPTVLAKDERGAPVELLDKRKMVEELRAKHKLDEKPAKSTSSSAKQSAEDLEKAEKLRAKEEAKELLREAAFARALAQIAEKAGDVDASSKKLTGLIRVLVGDVVERADYEAQEIVAERRELGRSDAAGLLGKQVENAKLGGLLSLAFEVLAAEARDAVIREFMWDKRSRETFESICELFGVDFKKQLELAKEAMAAEEKSEDAKAAKKGKK